MACSFLTRSCFLLNETNGITGPPTATSDWDTYPITRQPSRLSTATYARGIMPSSCDPASSGYGRLLPQPEQKFPVFWVPQLVQNQGPAASGLGLPQLPQNFPVF